MIITERFAIIIALAALMIGFSARAQLLLPIGVLTIIIVILLLIYDIIWLRNLPKPELYRNCDDKLSLGAENPVHIVIKNIAGFPLSCKIRDEYPINVNAKQYEFSVIIPGRSEVEHIYHINPSNRGDYKFGNTYMRIQGRFSFARMQIKYNTAIKVKVYPNLLDMRKYEIGLKKMEAGAGLKISRMRGKGTEFDSLREYIPDDDFRNIDWNASARKGKLISRIYQQERSQNIVLALDCGRVMGPIVNGLTRLDHSINSAMMIGYVASLNGDRVGLLAFGEEIQSFSAPKAGKQQLTNLLRRSYNLKDAQGDSNYSKALAYLEKRWKRRSLVIVFTELSDPVSSAPLITQLASIARKHLCLCVCISNVEVLNAVSIPAGKSVVAIDEVYQSTAARDMLSSREKAIAALRGSGVIVIDTPPDKLTPSVVQKYLEIKGTGTL